MAKFLEKRQRFKFNSLTQTPNEQNFTTITLQSNLIEALGNFAKFS